MSSIAKRMDVHFAALAAVGAVVGVGAAEKAQASIVWSGPVNLEITSSTNGLYLNVVTGATNQPGSTGGGTVPGWDVNPWSSGNLSYFNSGIGNTYVQNSDNSATANLVLGTLIDGTSVFGSGNAATTGNQPHILSSSANLIGFRFVNEALGGQTQYGWMRISLSTTLTAQPRDVVEYAYENTGAGITAGTTPTPTAGASLLALGGAGLLRRRRK